MKRLAYVLVAISLTLGLVGVIGCGGVSTPATTPSEQATQEEVAPARFEVSNLVIEPTEVVQGSPVKVSVVVKNVGGEAGTYNANLMVGGSPHPKDIFLEAGEEKQVSWEISTKLGEKTDGYVHCIAGEYSVRIEGLSSAFTVTKPEEKPAVEIIDTKMKVTDRSSHYVTVAYQVTLRNNEPQRNKYYIEITFYDADGFKLDYTNGFLEVDGNSEATLSDDTMISTEDWEKISKYRTTVSESSL